VAQILSEMVWFIDPVKLDCESASLPSLAGYANLTTQCFHQLAGDRQTQAAAGPFSRGPRPGAAPESIEDIWQILLRDTGAVILHLYAHTARNSLRAQDDFAPGAVRSPASGIALASVLMVLSFAGGSLEEADGP
jgi:hypothetical protein